MILLLQETLAYIEYQQHLLGELDAASSQKKYETICEKVSFLIIKLIKAQVEIKAECDSLQFPPVNDFVVPDNGNNDQIELTPINSFIEECEAIDHQSSYEIVATGTENYNGEIQNSVGDVIQSSILDKYASEEEFISTKGLFHCDICKKPFPSILARSKHRALHKDETEYTCDICGKAYKQKRSLNVHHFSHTGKKPFKCNTCGSAFTQQGSLIAHKRIHTGDKPYNCDICDKAFTQSASRNRHRLIHTGKKEFRCEICDKTFKRKENLKHHHWIHAGLKPFKCDKCEKAFRHKKQFNQHIFTAHCEISVE